ncbi:hypothetical protein GFS60_00631 [Rhodococcus sp. WAY2]|nr:hypothetical protein GFS60_00631 [Rhodococcus sp. WAY2]
MGGIGGCGSGSGGSGPGGTGPGSRFRGSSRWLVIASITFLSAD